MATGGESTENSPDLNSEDVNNLQCQPCSLDGFSAEAIGMCLTCQEYLCQPCYDVHRVPRPMRSHNLVRKVQMLNNQMSMDSNDKCTEICEYHTDKVIEYHCVTHDVLGCTVCITLHHRTCEGVIYIPKVAAALDSNTMYKQVEAELMEMEHKSQNIDTLSSLITSAIVKDSSDAIEKIQKIRSEIIQNLDVSEAQLKQKTISIRDEKSNKVIKLTVQCKQAQRDVEQMVKKIKGLKSGKQLCSLYMYMVKTRCQLQPLCGQLADIEHKLAIIDCHFSFNPNLENLETLKKQDVLGSVSFENLDVKVKTNVGVKNKNQSTFETKTLSTDNVGSNLTQRGRIDEMASSSEPVPGPIEKLRHLKDMDVKTKEDEEKCWITGLALMPDKRLVMADNHNENLKIVNIHTGQVTGTPQILLKSAPWDIALTERLQVAVTLPYSRLIAFVSLTATPVVDRYLTVNMECFGVDYKESKLVVGYINGKVEVLNLQGTILHTISESKGLLNFIFTLPSMWSYVAFSQDTKSVYVTGSNQRLKQYSLKGHVLSTYIGNKLNAARKIIADSNDNVYICDHESSTVHQLSSDLRQINDLLDHDDGLDKPLSICYNESEGEFYASMSDENRVKVYKVVNQS